MATGSGCFLSFSALTQQIHTVEGKRKNSVSLCETEAFPSSKTLNFQVMTIEIQGGA